MQSVVSVSGGVLRVRREDGVTITIDGVSGEQPERTVDLPLDLQKAAVAAYRLMAQAPSVAADKWRTFGHVRHCAVSHCVEAAEILSRPGVSADDADAQKVLADIIELAKRLERGGIVSSEMLAKRRARWLEFDGAPALDQ